MANHTTPVPPSSLASAARQPFSTVQQAPKPTSLKSFPLPKLRLEANDLAHQGTIRALTALNIASTITASTISVLQLLYNVPSDPTTTVSPTRSVTFKFRSMPGVAYTTGSDLDEDHKEIHLSLEYVAGIAPDRVADEICGVLTHELVHCFQYNGFGTCPAGLIEGIADWIRMRCGYVPPHWKRHASGKWDAGYQITGYFLDYLEKRFGDGLIRKLNEKLRVGRYEEKSFWHELVGHDINRLWEEYRQNFQP